MRPIIRSEIGLNKTKPLSSRLGRVSSYRSGTVPTHSQHLYSDVRVRRQRSRREESERHVQVCSKSESEQMIRRIQGLLVIEYCHIFYKQFV